MTISQDAVSHENGLDYSFNVMRSHSKGPSRADMGPDLCPYKPMLGAKRKWTIGAN